MLGVKSRIISTLVTHIYESYFVKKDVLILFEVFRCALERYIIRIDGYPRFSLVGVAWRGRRIDVLIVVLQWLSVLSSVLTAEHLLTGLK